MMLMKAEVALQGESETADQSAKKLKQMREYFTKQISSKGIEIKGLKQAYQQCSRTKEGRSKIAVFALAQQLVRMVQANCPLVQIQYRFSRCLQTQVYW